MRIHLLLILLTLILLSGVSCTFARNPEIPHCTQEPTGLAVSFLDVGQGDAILISCPDGITQTLIDAGPSEENYPGAAELLKRGLLSAMVNDRLIEHAINTHPHDDHSAGFLSILTDEMEPRFIIGRYYDNAADNTASSVEEKIRAELSKQQIPYTKLDSNTLDRIEICPDEKSIRLERIELPLRDRESLGCPNNLNDCSLVTKLTTGEFSILLLADATLNWERQALANLQLKERLRADILKVGHHAVESTSDALLSAVQPQAAIISSGTPGVGTTDIGGYPRADVISHLNRYFQTKAPGQKPSSQLLSVCVMVEGSCDWRWQKVAGNMLSTANSGTITVHEFSEQHNRGGLCIEHDQDLMFIP